MNLPPIFIRWSKFAPLALILVSAGVAVSSYLKGLGYPFNFDDAAYIPENTRLLGLHFADLWRIFTEPYNASFEFLPLRDLSYWLDLALSGQVNPPVFRLDNIILYLLSLPLIYAATMSLWKYFRPADADSAPWAAAIVTALFAIHPSLVESVVWISGRKYVLPNLFSLLALWLAAAVKRNNGFSAMRAAGALAAFAAVMLSKSSYVAVAPVIALLWIIFWLDLPAQHRRRSLLLWPFSILLLAVLLLLNFIAMNKGYDTVPAYFGIEAVIRSLAALGWMVRLAISPESRHFFYPVFEDAWLPAMVALGAAVLAAAIIGAVAVFRRRSFAGFLVAAFFILCIPYLQLIPGRPPSLVSDRYIALSVWLFVLLIVSAVWRFRPAARAAVLLVISLPWVYQTIERPSDWLNTETLVESDLRAYPGYFVPAAFEIGNIQLPRRMYAEAVATANGITDAQFRSLMLKFIKAYYAVEVDAMGNGDPRNAVALLWDLGLSLKHPPVEEKWNPPMRYTWDICAVALEKLWGLMGYQFPYDAMVNYRAGLWFLDSHKYLNAVSYLRGAAGSPSLPGELRGSADSSLGDALLNSGNPAEAEAPLRAALEQAPPDLRAYCLLSEVYTRTNRSGEAAAAEAECRSRFRKQEAAQ